jgi:hypothetical protein
MRLQASQAEAEVRQAQVSRLASETELETADKGGKPEGGSNRVPVHSRLPSLKRRHNCRFRPEAKGQLSPVFTACDPQER